MTQPRVSIVMPVYNAGEYVQASVQSVLDQTTSSWELVIVDDGSTDGAGERLRPYLRDPRISYVRQENQGVSAARNTGLAKVTGEWIGFLDADDALTSRSLQSRMDLLSEQPYLAFIDGSVETFDASLHMHLETWSPSFKGMPFDTLLFQTERCFRAPSWLVRNTGGIKPFKPRMTHGEDLLFLLMNASNGEYSYVKEAVLRYRSGHGSAMSNLRGLEEGYQSLYREIRASFPQLSGGQLGTLRSKYISIMRRSYLKRGALMDAFQVSRKFPL